MKRHPFDLVSFLPGVLAVGVALVALGGGLTIDLLATEWVWPSVLVALGLLVLASAGMGRRAPTTPEATPDDTADEAPDEAPAREPGEAATGDTDEVWPGR